MMGWSTLLTDVITLRNIRLVRGANSNVKLASKMGSKKFEN